MNRHLRTLTGFAPKHPTECRTRSFMHGIVLLTVTRLHRSNGVVDAFFNHIKHIIIVSSVEARECNHAIGGKAATVIQHDGDMRHAFNFHTPSLAQRIAIQCNRCFAIKTNPADLNIPNFLEVATCEADHMAIERDHAFRDTAILRKSSMGDEMPALTVSRQHPFRLQQFIETLDLILCRVPGHMDIFHAGRNHLNPRFNQPVLQAANGFFVARDIPAGEADSIAPL